MKQWSVLLSFFCAAVSGQEQAVVRPLEPGTILLKGWLGDKINLCIQNGISRRNVENLVAPFRTRTETSCWQTEPTMHMQETCVTQTLMKLLNKLYQITGDPALIDQMEISACNALLGAMKPDGSAFAKYSPLIGFRQEGEEQCGMGMNCCTANGHRSLLLIPQFAVMREKSGIGVNLFEALEAVTQTPSGKALIIRQSSEYPVSGLVQIRLQLKQKERFTVKIRIPAWSESTRLIINDREASQPAAGAYHLIDRLWKDNDLICLTLDLQPRWQQQPADHHRHVAVMRGPLVLARDQRWDSADVDEPAKPVPEQGEWVLHPITTLPRCWFACTVSCTLGGFQEMEFGRPRNLALVDYASAGSTWNRESRFRVWWPLALNPMEP